MSLPAPGPALDKEIAQKYLQHLVTHSVNDTPDSRKAFCDASGIHPKLLYSNPHIHAISKLYGDHSNIERLLDMTLRDYLYYHYYYIHQGYRYGASDLQQRWLGHDLIKTPFDCWIYQEIIWETKPDVVLEFGVMFGGASHFYASILDLVGHGEVIGVDISLAKVKEIRNKRISYIEGSSTADSTREEIFRRCHGKKVLIIADSDHEKTHVLNEARLYHSLVPVGGYYVFEDSLNDVMGYHPVPNEGPKAAALAFLAENKSFEPDLRFAERYIMSLNPHGYLRRMKP